MFEINTIQTTKRLKITQTFRISKNILSFVQFPPFYDPQHKNWSFLVDFVQNRKFLENRQTMKKNYYSDKI